MDTPILRREQRKRQRRTKYFTVIKLCKPTRVGREHVVFDGHVGEKGRVRGEVRVARRRSIPVAWRPYKIKN